jgi:negative regulator of flagellin synthesis FlgM
MRIDLTNAAASHISSEPAADHVKARQAITNPVAAEHEDRATLSAHTQPVGSLVNLAMNSPEIRQEKVDSLKAAVSSGNYKLDPAEIAQSMLDEHA